MSTTPTDAAAAPAMRAALISSDLDPALRQQVIDALRAAGFSDVASCEDAFQASEPPKPDGSSDKQALAESLKGRHFIVLDEWIGGRSAFEVHAILKAAPELEGTRYLLFLAAPAEDSRVFAGWKAGIDCVLTKPFNIDEFTHFCTLIRTKLEGGPAP